MRGVFQATIVDSAGDVVPECSIEIRDEATGDLVQVYDAIEDGNLLGNPFDADTDGFVRCYVERGLYRITATLGAFEREWRHVEIDSGAAAGSFAATLTGYASALTPTVSWHRTGHRVTLYVAAQSIGTSNATTMTLTGLPAAIRPARRVREPCIVHDDNGDVAGYGDIQAAASVVTLFTARTDVISDFVYTTGAFTSSGDKGLPAFWSLTYDLL